MSELKLNSISSDILEARDINTDEKIKVNSTDGSTSEDVYRSSIVSTGRLVACEYFGNKLKGYKTKLNSETGTLAEIDKSHKEAKLMYCATLTNRLYGKPAPKDFKEVKNNRDYATDEIFLRVMAQIDKEVLTPLFFSILDDVGMGLMRWESVGLGQTKEIDIKSNDVFLFEDTAIGSSKSASNNYLYKKSVFLNTKSYSTNVKIKWYDDVVNGEAGDYYAAIMGGMWNKIYAKLMGAMKLAVNNTAYVPSALTASTYTTQNWIKLTDLLAAANGVRVDDLVAIGTRSALSNLLPVDGQGGAITGLQYGLGERWFENAFLPRAASVDLMPISPVVVPGTQNNEILTIDTGDDIYILAKGAYKPMVGIYAEGSPMELTLTPDKTADLTINMNVTAFFDIAPLFASKVAVMTSVYPSE